MAIDSRLKWILTEREATAAAGLAEAVSLIEGAARVDSTWNEAVDVLVRAAPTAERDGFTFELKRMGFEVHSVAGKAGAYTATGRTHIDNLVRLDTSPMVARVEIPRDLLPELLVSIPATGAQTAHTMAPPAIGDKALVGIVDGGIDYTHAVFRDANGTRIAALWDQAAASVPGGPVPYGRVFRKPEIDQALAGPVLIHADPIAHGTHVASIAAGVTPREGVAPGANLLVVSLGSTNGVTLGRSNNAIDAFTWIVNEARAAGLPVAINMSQGMNGGGHVGASLLELAMDALCREPGVAIVKSAGNEQEFRCHASGSLVAGPLTFEVICQAGKRTPGALEIWFDQDLDLEVSIQPPSGAGTAWFNLINLPQTISLGGGNLVRIDVEHDPEGTQDNLLNVFFSSSGAIGLLPGTWRVQLRSTNVVPNAPIHAWLERTARTPAAEQLRFSAASTDLTCTISIPGTARRVVTVGSYVTTPSPPGSALVGALSSFSSHGPTRYGVQKPDLVAPGEVIEAARSAQMPVGAGQWLTMPGTSMAAPHVTGAAALILSEDKRLTGEQVRQILASAAAQTASSPDNAYGGGRLDVARAIALVRAGQVAFPVVTGAIIAGSSITLTTAGDTTASLLYDTSAGRVLAGRRMGSLASLVPTKTHVFDLATLGSGTWFFEIHVFANAWRTIADDNGAAWSITVP